jgi:Domain of unknown function (DUF4484)/DENN domain-containing protein 11
MSNIPNAVADLLSAQPSRLRPLFSIGVHDIPLLETEARKRANFLDPLHTVSSTVLEDSDDTEDLQTTPGSWIACTTDGILQMKKTLYDVIVTLPPNYSKDAQNKVWPTVEDASGIQIKATQRDLRKYRSLRKSFRLKSGGALLPSADGIAVEHCFPRRKSDGSVDTGEHEETPDYDTEDDEDEKVCEKVSWPELAYSSFLWWASAGEKRDDLGGDTEDADMEDETLPLLSMEPTPKHTPKKERRSFSDVTMGGSTDVEVEADTPQTTPRRRTTIRNESQQAARPGTPAGVGSELGILTYFHRLTTRMFVVLSSIVDSSPASPTSPTFSGSEDEEEEEKIYVSSEDMARMGLDVWSEGDRKFVEEIVDRWFDRGVEVERLGIGICGIKVC